MYAVTTLEEKNLCFDKEVTQIHIYFQWSLDHGNSTSSYSPCCESGVVCLISQV